MYLGDARPYGPGGLRFEHAVLDGRAVTIRATSTDLRAGCPVCGRISERVHSRYARVVSDLPWRGIAVTLEVRARRFFCDASPCEGRIFCERLPGVAAHARKTARLEDALLAIAVELGGEAGARLAWELGLLVGPDALLDRLAGKPRRKVLDVDVAGPEHPTEPADVLAPEAATPLGFSRTVGDAAGLSTARMGTVGLARLAARAAARADLRTVARRSHANDDAPEARRSSRTGLR